MCSTILPKTSTGHGEHRLQLYRLRLLSTHSLEYRRLCSDLVLCFQLLCNGFNSNSLTLSLNLLIIELGHNFKLVKQRCSMDTTKYYFTNRFVNIWNSLPCHSVCYNSPKLSTFKPRLQNHDLSSWSIEFTL